MSDIMFSWEIGTGYGHLDILSRLAEPLAARGYRCHFAIEELWRAGTLTQTRAGLRHARFYQAPFNRVMRSAKPKSVSNLAEFMCDNGYYDPGHLIFSVKAWLNLIDRIQPAVLVADYSPSALLAARIRNLPTVSVNNGYLTPPATTPLPDLQPWLNRDLRTIPNYDERLLESCNTVLKTFGAKPLQTAADLFAADKVWLTTFAECDHYARGQNHNVTYAGPLFAQGGGRDQSWANRKGPKVVAYLSWQHKMTRLILQNLALSGLHVLAHIRDMGEAEMRSITTDKLKITPEPIDLRWAMRHASYAVTHGGFGTMMNVMLAGKPIIIFPQHAEQALLGYRLSRQDLAMMVSINDLQKLGPKIFQGMMSMEKRIQACKAFGKRYQYFDQDKMLRDFADMIGHMAPLKAA